jgi:hypothetical protein
MAHESEPQVTSLPDTASDADIGSRDHLALAHLWSAQFQHLTTLGVAGAGGVFVLIESGVVATGELWWVALAFFALTAVFSINGQIAVSDDAAREQAPGTKPRRLRGAALLCLGAASGAAVGILL